MRRYFYTMAMSLLVTTLAAQQADSLKHRDDREAEQQSAVEVSGEGVQLNFGEQRDEDERESKKDRDRDVFDFGIFGGIDLGFNTFMVDGDLNLPSELGEFEHKVGNSTNVQLRFLHVDFRPDKHVRMNIALGLDYNDWALENNVTLQPEQEQVTFLQEDINFSKNKLKAKYLVLPFNLQLRTSDDITFTGGFEPQFLLRGRVKQVSDERGKTKVDDDFNLREFRYAWVGRIGYNGFSVFCRYYPKSIFADGEGPDMQNISFGIGWGL